MARLRVQLSILVPIHNEAPSLPSFFGALIPELEALSIAYEIIAIDDGSTDESWAMLEQYRKTHDTIRLVRLMRSFGKEAAMLAGMDHAEGAAVLFIDADLQHPPATVAPMFKAWKNGAKIVLAQNSRHSKRERMRVFLSGLFLRLVNIKNGNPIPIGTGDFQLLDRQAVDAIKAMPERVRFLRGQSAWLGLKTELVPYDCEGRQHGTSNYGVYSLWKIAMDGFSSITDLPFTLCILSALLLVAGSAFSILFIGGGMPLWIGFLLAGLQLGAVGLLGQYVFRLLTEVKKRPVYLLLETRGF